jgi:hypothetical protein
MRTGDGLAQGVSRELDMAAALLALAFNIIRLTHEFY